MEKIRTGILGLGSVSTLYYLKRLNEEYNKMHGGYSTFPCLLVSADFDKVNPYLPDQFEQLEQVLIPYFRYFDAAGVSKLLLPNITIHETVDRIIEHSSFKFIIVHPLQLIVEKLRFWSVSEVYLLGTKYTMESGYVAAYLSQHGIECLPISEEMKQLSDKLRREIYTGHIVGHEKIESQLINYFGNRKKIVLACSELSVLFSSFKGLSFYDMAEEQINYIINTTL